MPRAAAQRASAEAKRAEAALKERTRNDPSDFTDFTCSGTGPAKLGAGADIGVQRLVAQAFGGGRRIDDVDADLVGVVGGIVADLMAGAALAAGDEKSTGQDQAGGALDKLATGRIAGSTVDRCVPGPGRPIMAPAHYCDLPSVLKGSGRVGKHGRSLRSGCAQASQVVFSQLAAAVDSLCDVPGLGQFGGAVMSRIGMVMIDFGSQTGKSYLGSFLVIPITVSL